MPLLLLEHHGKTLLRRHGIETPAGAVLTTEADLRAALPGFRFPVVMKAQVPAGGRGKAGGILTATDADQALDSFRRLIGLCIGGHATAAVLAEERFAARAERYAAAMIRDGELVLTFGAQGGVDVEAITAGDARNMLSVVADPFDGADTAELRAGFRRLGYPEAGHAAWLRLAAGLHALSRGCDALLAEINPLAELTGGSLLALDARIAIDADALPRQPGIAAMLGIDPGTASAKTVASLVRIRKNPAGGTIGLIGIGSGLNLTIMDWIDQMGAGAASLVDIDPAIMAGQATEGFRLALEAYDGDPAIRAILINVITCGYRLDDIVAALMAALAARGSAKPVVLHLYGNAMDNTPAMLAASGRRNAASLREAIAQVVAAVGS